MLRAFTDAVGREWQVWQVLPSGVSGSEDNVDSFARVSLTGTPFAEGWLCFESPLEKRRLAPIPDGWEHLEDGLLEQLCQRAEAVRPRAERKNVATYSS